MDILQMAKARNYDITVFGGFKDSSTLFSLNTFTINHQINHTYPLTFCHNADSALPLLQHLAYGNREQLHQGYSSCALGQDISSQTFRARLVHHHLLPLVYRFCHLYSVLLYHLDTGQCFSDIFTICDSCDNYISTTNYIAACKYTIHRSHHSIRVYNKCTPLGDLYFVFTDKW